MLKIGKLIFGTKAELLDSLFYPVEGKTLDGVYKRRKYGIALNRGNGEPWMFLVANRWGERFIVSACKLGNGKTWYSHGITPQDKEAIGLTYSQRLERARDVWDKLTA